MKEKKCINSFLLKMFLVMSFVLFVGCGSDDDDSTTVTIENPDQEERQEQQGTFSTTPMVVINNRIENNIQAITRVIVDNENVNVTISCQEAPDGIPHKQVIHTGSRCPTMADDTNNDGVIDQVESEVVTGPPLIVLDSDLSSADENTFPLGNSYEYEQTVPADELRGTLPPGENLGLERRVVVIYGVEPSVELPETVSTNTDDPVNLTVPVSCGVIENEPQTSGGTTGGETGDGDGGETGNGDGGEDETDEENPTPEEPEDQPEA